MGAANRVEPNAMAVAKDGRGNFIIDLLITVLCSHEVL
jgi:hypothetical protein